MAPQLLGEPAIGVFKYGNAASKSPAPTVAPSVYGKLPAGASAGTQPNVAGSLSVHRTPIAARSSMSTTSSPGRRPFGKPATSPPSTPRFDCDPAGVAAVPVFKRSISPGADSIAGFVRPGMPVRNTATRSLRGKLFGARTPRLPNSASSSSGSDGFVT